MVGIEFVEITFVFPKICRKSRFRDLPKDLDSLGDSSGEEEHGGATATAVTREGLQPMKL